MTKRIGESGSVTSYWSPGAEIVARAVCANCNGGWMAALESQARPLLAPMINGNSCRLTSIDQKIIGRWAAKTAVMLLYSASPPVGIEAPHRAALLAGRIPPNTGIWIASLHVNPPEYNSWIRVRTIEMRRSDQHDVIKVGQSVTLTLGYFVQQVLFTPADWFGHPLPPLSPTRTAQFFVEIPQQNQIAWPPHCGSVSISDLEAYADEFSANGLEIPRNYNT